MNNEQIEAMKERILQSFLDGLEQIAFVKSTNSVTGEVQEYPPAVEDMEAVIKINGEFDREDLKNFIVSRAG